VKSILFISILILSFGIYAQSDTLNQKDSLGKRQGYWIIYGEDEPHKGYPAEGKISEGTYLNDRKHGEWVMYYDDGKTIRVKGSFKHNRPNGVFEKYYEDGTLKERGTFKKVRYTDTLKRFYESGHLKELIVYDSTGLVLESFSKPQVIRDSTGMEIYRIVEPPLVEYYYNKSTDTSRVNNEDGYNKIPDGNHDKSWMEGEFKNGRLWNGKLYIYDDDGLLLRIEIYKDGKYYSDGQL